MPHSLHRPQVDRPPPAPAGQRPPSSPSPPNTARAPAVSFQFIPPPAAVHLFIPPTTPDVGPCCLGPRALAGAPGAAPPEHQRGRPRLAGTPGLACPPHPSATHSLRAPLSPRLPPAPCVCWFIRPARDDPSTHQHPPLPPPCSRSPFIPPPPGPPALASPSGPTHLAPSRSTRAISERTRPRAGPPLAGARRPPDPSPHTLIAQCNDSILQSPLPLHQPPTDLPRR